ncbi:MAG: putative tRNA-dihydrouridine synthase [Alphaproteobacteria bacterium]|nr:MAG: putative tRNA-dihydrouridine synthase [Alphaproteobacteria bacterium]
MLNIGKLQVNSNFLLAPMSGVTDYPYREIVKKFKPGLVFSEMIASRALLAQNSKTMKMIKKTDNYLSAVQIAGCDPEIMAEASKICEDNGADIIDINMGCPVKKVVNGYAGSALMKDEILATKILESVANSVKVPVTLKMRKGWDDNSLNAPKIAKIAENSGIKMITIHGRTRCQMYKGKSDWKFVKNVKSNVKIPVLVNGDITNKENLKQALKDSKADGVMIGRGSYGRPWIFEELCSNKKKFKIDNNLKKQIILNHLQLSLDHYGKDIGLKSFRKHLGWYSKSINNSNEFRLKINQCTDEIILKNLINDFF